MGIDLFAEINQTNRAYCASRGLSSAELYGTPPNADELETHHLIASGVPAEAAVFRPRKAKHLLYWPRTPFQRLGYIAERIAQGCAPLPTKAEFESADKRRVK